MKLIITKKYDKEDKKYKEVYQFTNIKDYSPIDTFSENTKKEVFDFAYGMSFGLEGYHRDHRSGGYKKRKNGEIFADTFQGKLAEFALWNVLVKNKFEINKPDTEMYEDGIWDSSDFEYMGKKIAVKSTKSFGQLLLLEYRDWNQEGLYIPNLGTDNQIYDYFVLIRLYPFIADILKENKLYYCDKTDKDDLKSLILAPKYTYDIPGYISRDDLIHIIKENYYIPQNAYLNRIEEKNKMDADNYYIQAGNLYDINELIKKLKKL